MSVKPVNKTVPEGWETITDLQKTYVGRWKRIRADIEDFIATKKQELQNQGMSEAGVEETLSDKWRRTYSKNGEDFSYVSPATRDALDKSGKFILKIKPYAPPDWPSFETIKSQYVGGNDEAKRAKITAFVTKQKAALVEKGHTPQQADIVAARRWAGVYAVRPGAELARRFEFSGPSNGQITDFHINPEILSLLEKSGVLIRTQQLAPQDWPTAEMLREDYIGGLNQIERKLKQFLRDRVNGLVTEGTPRKLAEQMTHRNWGDYLKAPIGGMAFHYNPEAVKFLEHTGVLVPRSKQAGPIPQDWKSGSMLKQEYVGTNTTLDAKIEKFIASKTGELIASGMNETDAAKTVQDEWAGIYRTEQGQHAKYISPKGVQELEAAGTITSLVNRTPRAPEGWQPISVLSGKDSTVAAKIKAFLEEKEAQMPKDEARKVWGGVLATAKGRDGLFLSPQAETELVERGVLKPREQHAQGSHLARELKRRAGSAERKI